MNRQVSVALKLGLILSITLLLSCGVSSCIKQTTSTNEVREDQTSSGQKLNLRSPDVEKWKTEFSKNFEDLLVDGDEAWGLFSAGGLSGQGVGHFMVFATKEGKSGRIRIVPIGGTSVGADEEIAGDRLDTFSKQMSVATSLSSVEKEGFDVYEYEYINLKRVSGKVQIVKNIKMRGIDNVQYKDHTALINAFKTIAK